MNNYYIPDQTKYMIDNPIQPGNILWWGVGYPKEIFYEIDFYGIKTGMYVISSYGRVFSRRFNGEMRLTRTSGREGFTDYIRITLRLDNGDSRLFAVHRLVAMAFIPKTKEDIMLGRDIVNHKDLSSTNNIYLNLEWCTDQENIIHAHQNNARGLINPYLQISLYPLGQGNIQKEQTRHHGESNALSRITDQQVHIICQTFVNGGDIGQCCVAAGLEVNERNRNVVTNILNGNRRTQISSQYQLNYKAKEMCNYSNYRDTMRKLLIEHNGVPNKAIYDMMKNQIPYKPGETDKKHYDRIRVEIGNVKKKLIKEGLL